MEAELARHVLSLGKTPMGWEEILFQTAGAQATPNKSAIVAAWARHSAAQVVAAGYRAVEANAKHFYLTTRMHGPYSDSSPSPKHLSSLGLCGARS